MWGRWRGGEGHGVGNGIDSRNGVGNGIDRGQVDVLVDYDR